MPHVPGHQAEEQETIAEMIYRVFREAGLSDAEARFAVRVASGESSLRSDAVGDAGTSFGLWQLHTQGLLPAFAEWANQQVLGPARSAQELAKNPELATRWVAQYIASQGPQAWNNWTVARNLAAQGEGPSFLTDALSTSAAQPFSSTRAAQELAHEQRIAELREQARLARLNEDHARAQELENEIELLNRRFRQERQLARESQQHQLKLQLLGEAGDLIQRRAELAQQARTLIAQTLGTDPFQAATLSRGQAQAGVTPTQQFRSQLQEAEATLGRPAQFNPFGNPQQLQQGVERLRGEVVSGLPQPSGLTGLAGGGTIDMTKGGDGSFAMEEPVRDAVLVGEEGPEVMLIGDGKLTVVPLTGSAQFGGEFSFGPTSQSAAQVLSPVFEHLGLQGVPFGRRVSGTRGTLRPSLLRTVGGPIQATPFSSDMLARLGVNPELVRVGERIFQVDPEGVFHPFESLQEFNELGFDPRQVVQVQPSFAQGRGILPEFEIGEPVTERGVFDVDRPGFLGTPLVEPETGILLPHPALIASLLRPGVLDPATAFAVELATDRALGAPGLTRELAMQHTPTGTAGLTATLA